VADAVIEAYFLLQKIFGLDHRIGHPISF